MSRILMFALTIVFLFCLHPFIEASADEKDTDIRKLIEVTDMVNMTNEVVTLVVNQMVTTLQNSNEDVPTIYFTIIREEVPRVINENLESYIESVIPILKKNYTDNEIKELVEFYQTPLGKKLLEKQPIVTAEIVQAALVWTQNMEPLIRERIDNRIEEENKKTH